MKIRIVTRPLGEAPEDIRDAWIGLALPVAPKFPTVVERRIFGVLSSPRAFVSTCLRLLFGRRERMRGYMVDAVAAIDTLREKSPQAAEWWQANTQHLIKPGLCLLFDEDCCVVEG
jgi:hypothetical protein